MPKSQHTVRDDQGVSRCWWCGTDPLYVDYHDREWGRPTYDDQRLFEKICLEGFQSGLSWITVLRKRPAFREAFKDFEPARVAKMTKRDIERQVKNAEIIRHRGKIESTINNAKRALELIEEQGSLSDFFWQFKPARHRTPRKREQIPATTSESTALSKELKRRGWSFVGPTTCYAFMQAMGLVNDHLRSCHAWQAIQNES